MKAIFVVPLRYNESDVEPDFGGFDLGKEAGNGYSLVGQVPQAPTCLALVDSSPETIAAMEASEDFLLVEEV